MDTTPVQGKETGPNSTISDNNEKKDIHSRRNIDEPDRVGIATTG